MLARSDSAGATHLFAAACRKRGVRFSFGFPVDERVQRIVDLIPDQCWHPAIEDEGLRDGVGAIADPVKPLITGWLDDLVLRTKGQPV